MQALFIEGFNNKYAVREDGAILSLKSGEVKVLKAVTLKSKTRGPTYAVVCLYKASEGKAKTY